MNVCKVTERKLCQREEFSMHLGQHLWSSFSCFLSLLKNWCSIYSSSHCVSSAFTDTTLQRVFIPLRGIISISYLKTSGKGTTWFQRIVVLRSQTCLEVSASFKWPEWKWVKLWMQFSRHRTDGEVLRSKHSMNVEKSVYEPLPLSEFEKVLNTLWGYRLIHWNRLQASPLSNQVIC